MNGVRVALAGILLLAGCAGGVSPPEGDAGEGEDAGLGDSGLPDAGPPDTPPDPDAGSDAGFETVGLCETCTEHVECGASNFCATLSSGEQACVVSCNPDIPNCPTGFNCVVDLTAGTDGNPICIPSGGPCCIDEDEDEHGQGIGCLGPDCDDEDPLRNPAMMEICNGIDEDCDGSVDDPPTDCVSGRCDDDGDGTYTGVSGATCTDAMCADGDVVDCMLFTCAEGGEMGTTCAASCSDEGVDSDALCIEPAHCDGGLCEPDVPDGGMCDEDSDCSAGHCDNGFCCSGGTCCFETADCPGGGMPTTLCDDAETCQGTRGETQCNAEFRCETIEGIEDDSACTSSVEALNCAPYDPVFCDGTSDQMEPDCPTSCIGDGECIDAAHCEGGFCVPDRPPGGICGRTPDCQSDLFCVDGRCCNSMCSGTCEACDLPGLEGSCAPVPPTADIDNECLGYSCSGYYSGFSGGTDTCFSRQDVTDTVATCNGARACISPATQCPMQPTGPLQIDCNNTCQAPVAGTCTGMMPGMCRDLDDAADTVTCGVGECSRTVQRCSGGVPNMCTPGAPVLESCNLLDDDCDGTPDDGTGAALCPAAPGATNYMCAAGMCSFECNAGQFDVNGTYSDGCECSAGTAGSPVCAAASPLGTIAAGGAASTTGVIADGSEAWFTVNFPSTSRGPVNGNIQLSLTGPSAPNFRFDVFTNCTGTTAPVATGAATDIVSYTFVDDASSGINAYTGPHLVSWPSTVLIRVRRVMPVTTCTQGVYNLSVSR